MDTNTDELRATIARGWLNSSLKQADYAKQHGISPRTLRTWVAKYATTRQPPGEQVRAVIVEAIEKLQVALDAIDRAAATSEAIPIRARLGADGEAGGDPRVATAPRRTDREAAAEDEHASHVVPRPSQPPPKPVPLVPARRLAPTPSFFSDF